MQAASPHPSIPDGRRTALVTAAIREFAGNGYLAASTNRIVEAAGVSKGLLFHYFGDKKGLYLYAVQTCITEVMRRFDERLGPASPDLFERLRQYTLTKWSLIEEQLSTFAFLQEAMTDPPAELRDALLASTAEITASTYQRLFQGIDTSAFRPGVTVEQAMHLLSWTFDGLGKQYTTLLRQQPLDLASVRSVMFGEVDTYVALLRHGIETDPS
ncbi:TetR/AcrR family transcriptional regulator [Candidatus Cryosericum septentrionale]|jgi:TetR/AcrR family transcriptional regulator|uniref:TetR/AcrR family transcriptional regulator n=1 Tax=Candidatus Cryosericum septentrionale TaxID=2290913 RepID=A0A398DTQ8_9BACT|nr:TetR/AcrR family transcriptional regulator [Candidatus Cryosericum septentrionale]RIE17463.1 TetR/AcrR family transcriptional regulator [Candidatus Cryosericum septentrionale]